MSGAKHTQAFNYIHYIYIFNFMLLTSIYVYGHFLFTLSFHANIFSSEGERDFRFVCVSPGSKL